MSSSYRHEPSVFSGHSAEMERDVATALLDSQALKNALSLLLQRVCRERNWDCARAWLPVPDTIPEAVADEQSWRLGAVWPDDFAAPNGKAPNHEAPDFVVRAHRRKEEFWTNERATRNSSTDSAQTSASANDSAHISAHASTDSANASSDIEYSMCALAIPVCFGERVVVILEFLSRDAKVSRHEEAAQIAQMAQSLTPTFEREHEFQTLSRNEEWLRAAADGSIVSFSILNVVRDEIGAPCDLKFVFANACAASLLGLPQDQVVGRNLLEVVASPDASCLFEQCLSVIETRQSLDYETMMPDGTPQERWLRYQIVAVRDDVAITAQDISKRKRAIADLRASEDRFRTLIEHSSDIISIMDGEGTILYESPSVERILGWKPEELVGRNAFEFVHLDDAERTGATLASLVPESGATGTVCFRFLCRDGSWKHMEAVGNNMIEQREVGGILVNSRDISERVLQEEQIRLQRRDLERANGQLHELATRDGLTKLKNQRAFLDEIAQSYAQSQRHSWPLSLAILDVDCFKQFNDTFGHQAGDRVLVCVADLLQEHSRNTDFVARYGGEEFVILMRNTPQKGALEHAERLRAAIESAHWPVKNVTASFGVATWHPESRTALHFDGDTIFEHADRALYHSKNRGRNCVTHNHDLR